MTNLFERALATTMHARFVARSEDLRRPLTNEEVVKEARYLLETIPQAGMEKKEEQTALKELRRLVKGK